MNKFRFLVIVSLFFSFPSFAQLQSYKKGLASFDKGYYDIAINEFLKVKEIASTELANLNLKIAESYRLSNRWLLSLPYYQKAFESGLVNDVAVFHYAYALKSNEEYEKAFQQFEKYIALKTTDKVLNERANREINTLKIIEEIKGKKDEKVFRNLKEVNTPAAEFSALVNSGYLVYSSSKKEKIYSNGLPFLGIYKNKINPDLTSIEKSEVFSSSVFDVDRNEGTPTFSPDGKVMVFARGNSGKKKDVSPDVDLYMSRFVPNEGWLEPKLISASDSVAWDGSPAFSRDGKTLYFASNREGGVGGMDIYRVNMDASGRFGNPVNMGKVINTAGDEMFPFVSPDGKLFFASDGHPGLGKLDLFVAVRSGGKIYIENLGLPYNTAMDDFAYSIDENENVFFSSNRPGGLGDDDIYFYQAPPKPEVVVEKPVIDDPNNPESPNYKRNSIVKTVNYYLAGKINGRADTEEYKPLAEARVRLLKIESGLENEVDEVYSSVNGEFGPIKLEEDADYLILVDKKDYLTKREDFTMYGRSIPQRLLIKPVTDTTFRTVVNLDKVFIGKTFRLENIYYDLDKFDIRTDAALELNKLVQILVDNPSIIIELGSHTDSRGSDIYNLRLSQKRAEAAINYLISKGIERSRLSARGYGETELIVESAKTEEEHQVNRRTEFKVVEISEAKPE